MKNVNKYLSYIALFVSGMIMSSVYITHSENWKYYLPVCLLAMTFGRLLDK